MTPDAIALLARLADAADRDARNHAHECGDPDTCTGIVDLRADIDAARAIVAIAQGAPARSFAEIGRAAARDAQRAALLGALEGSGWRLSVVGRQLRIGLTANVIRAIHSVGLDAEYAAAQAAGLLTHDPRRGKVIPSLTRVSESGSVAA